MLKLQVILGSTRPVRAGEEVAKWVTDIAKERTDLEVELVDVADYNLPLLDEPQSALTGIYSKDHTKKWSSKIAEADAFIFVTAEYNHGIPGAFKNAVDFLYAEWADKPFGLVGYGAAEGGSRAIEQWRQVLAQVGGATVKSFMTIPHIYMGFAKSDDQVKAANAVIDDVIKWGTALKTVRA